MYYYGDDFLAKSGLKSEAISGEDLELVTLYFADRGEDLWYVAKEFSTSMQSIMEQNNLSSDVMTTKQFILIPEM